MKLVTFAMSALVKATEESRFGRIAESIPSGPAHAVGVGSGLTGVALWAEWAKHLTVLAGLVVALLAMAGGAFYAAYWGFKAIREYRAWRDKVPVRKSRGGEE